MVNENEPNIIKLQQIQLEDIENQKKKFTCKVCYYDYELNDIKSLTSCNHIFCKECLTDYFTSLITDQNKHDDIKCPEHECGAKPTEEELKELVGTDVYQKFQKFELNMKVASNPNLIFCPSVDCEEVLDLKEGSKLSCTKCGKSICAKFK